ncbi:hypothetical protein E2C01_029842 [Portunus trituberculatus]|uniref:Uncharacterized protein n=1 Tax=Portunus trituberculatus TaxID=210409 RepID=A0A5B7ETB0_PORTR|nr:hypothetical protein [Portunus trituberculatus]
MTRFHIHSTYYLSLDAATRTNETPLRFMLTFPKDLFMVSLASLGYAHPSPVRQRHLATGPKQFRRYHLFHT